MHESWPIKIDKSDTCDLHDARSQSTFIDCNKFRQNSHTQTHAHPSARYVWILCLFIVCIDARLVRLRRLWSDALHLVISQILHRSHISDSFVCHKKQRDLSLDIQWRAECFLFCFSLHISDGTSIRHFAIDATRICMNCHSKNVAKLPWHFQIHFDRSIWFERLPMLWHRRLRLFTIIIDMKSVRIISFCSCWTIVSRSNFKCTIDQRTMSESTHSIACCYRRIFFLFFFFLLLQKNITLFFEFN